MTQDPYASPKADLDAARPAEVAQEKVKMPGTVIATIVLVAVLMVFEIIGVGADPSIKNFASLPISALILLGLVRGHALAWQCGIVIPTLFAIFGVIGVLAILDAKALPPAPLVGVAIPLAIYIAIPILPGVSSSRVFFGL